jgi:hypothetical protein
MRSEIARRSRFTRAEVLGVTALPCLRSRVAAAGAVGLPNEQIQALYLTSGGNVYVWPGVTGYEGYAVSSVMEMLAKAREDFVPKSGIFGMSKWAHSKFCLNAGSATYDQLTTTVFDLVEAMVEVGAITEADASNLGLGSDE